LLAALNSQSGILVTTALIESTLDDFKQPLQVAVANNKQEWEICNIVSKEDVNGVLHY
jgi:hypothetical protein